MPDERQVVAEGYDEIAGRYLKWTTASPTRLKWLQTLVAMLPANARILDLGCGAGIPLASTLADQGHHVTGIDGSRQQIALARINEPRGQFVVADMTAIEFAASSFDAVTAFYSITHVPRDLHRTLLDRIQRWLKPGGLFLASLGHDDTPSWTGDWLGTTMYFSHFDAATNQRMVEQAGFDIEAAEITGDHEDGHVVRFLWLVGRKPGLHAARAVG